MLVFHSLKCTSSHLRYTTLKIEPLFFDKVGSLVFQSDSCSEHVYVSVRLMLEHVNFSVTRDMIILIVK